MQAKGYNVDAIKSKLEEAVEKQKEQSKVKEYQYKPQNDDVVRYVPFKDGTIYYENYMHFLAKGIFIACPKTIGQKCALCEESEKLFKKANELEKGSPEWKTILRGAFKLGHKKSGVIPVHIKFRMSEGVLKPFEGEKLVYFDFLNGKATQSKPDEIADLESSMRDPDYGNITDPVEGHDATMKMIKIKTGNNVWDKREIKIRPKSSKLAENQEKINEILNSVPEFLDIFKYPEYTKTVEFLEKWLGKDEVMDFPPRDGTVNSEKTG